MFSTTLNKKMQKKIKILLDLERNGRYDAYGLNFIIFFNSDLIFEFRDENYSI